MNIIICVLLVISIIISAAALITGLKGKQGNDIALLDQKIDITAKRTDEALHNVSLQMQALTEKNYEQMSVLHTTGLTHQTRWLVSS